MVKPLIFLVIILFSQHVFCYEEYQLAEIKSLQNLSRNELIKKLGQPDRINGETYLYKIEDYKYGLNIRFSNDRVSYIRYLPQQIRLTMKEQHRSKAVEYSQFSTNRAEYLLIEKEQWSFLFHNNKRMQIHSIIWDDQK